MPIHLWRYIFGVSYLLLLLCLLKVLLVAPVGRRLKDHLPDAILIPTFTNDSQEEVHMILEYSSGDTWGEVSSYCSNRVIFSHDVSNSKMVALESVKNAMYNFSPDFVVLSGAHLLEGQKKEFWEHRLKDITTLLEVLSRVPVHWELATVGDAQFLQEMSRALFPRVDSLGLNEQELLMAARVASAPFNFDVIPKKPGIEWVSDLLHWFMMTYSSVGSLNSALTRVHLHSLSFHLICTVEGGPWTNSKEAVMAGASTAGLQACESENFTSAAFTIINPEQFSISMTDILLSETFVMTSSNGWTMWSREGLNYYFSPVLVCKNPTRTVGLGDAISALGILYSQFVKK